MRRLLLITAFAALAVAKPGTYRETEDFQYSRSSSDEGHKAGYYGAQRGNMGGNFEKAHNMDSLAQNQMSSAVNQVQGEIGDTADAPAGNVFTSANTKGIYGRGAHYDLTNLHGRNFQEGVNVDDSRSHSSLSSLNSGYGSQSSLHNTGYTGGYSSLNTKKSGYSGLHTSGQYYQAADQRAAAANDNAYTDLFDRQTGQRSAYDQQAGYGGYNRYEQRQSSQHAAQSNYGSDSHTRLVGAGAAPVRVVIRPGSTINVPVAAETYDSRHTASAFDQNSINSEAEVLTNANNQQITGFKPTNHGKSYESSYSYNKQWEKHDTVPAAAPLAIPTVNPYPVNSELHEDYASNRYHGSAANAQNQLSHNYLGYNAAASNLQHQSGYNTHQTKSSVHATNANTYNSAFKNAASNSDAASLVSGINADGTPKSYESSYAYRKSWERQGDPYVIQPATGPVYDSQASQRLKAGTAASHGEYRSNKHASHSGYSQSALEEDCECDEQGHVRVARSYGSEVDTDQRSQKFQDDGQIVQNSWNLEDLRQQTQQNQFENLEDLTQQSQQNQFDSLEDLGQQTQNKWDLEDLTQQTQENKFDKYHISGQQTQEKPLGKLEDLGQRTQGNQFDKLEDLGQQAQSKWEVDDLGQQTQNFDKYYQTRHGPQRQGNLDKLNPASQHDQARMQSFNQGIQTSHGESSYKDSFQLQGNYEKPIEIEQTFSQRNQPDQIEDVGQQTEYGWDKLEILNKHKPKNPQQDDLVKPTWEQSEDDTQQAVSKVIQSDQNENVGQQTEYGWDKLEILNQHKPKNPQQDDLVKPIWEQSEDDTQQAVSQGIQSDQIGNVGQQTEYGWDKLEILNQHKPKHPQQDDLVKPVWQSEDDTQKASDWQNNREGHDQQSHHGTGHGWYVNEFASTQENQDWLNQQMRGSNLHTYHNFNSNSHHGSSLQSLWDKIDNLEEQSVTSMNSSENQNNNGDKNQFSHGYGSHSYNTQHSYQTWDHINSEDSQSSHHQNSFGSSYTGSNPWQFDHGGQNTDKSQETVNSGSHTWQWNGANKIFTEMSTTEKTRQGSGSTIPTYPWQRTPVIEETQTTEKSKDSHKSSYGDRGDIGGDDKDDDDVKPNYPGRGDIGADGNGTTIDKPKTTILYSPENSNLNTKPFKTPEEIETLSLTKESEEKKPKNVNKNTNLNANSQSDAGLSVISINEQWLNEQKRHRSNSDLDSTSTTTPTPASNINQNNQQSQTINGASDHGFTFNNYNRKPYGPSVIVQNNKESDQADVLDQRQIRVEGQNTDQQFVDFSNLSQQNTDKHFGFEDQQSQTPWGGDLKDLGQQVQTSWNQNENLEQQSDLTQQTGSFETFGQPIQTDNFYEQKYQSANYQSPQTAPVETSQKSNADIVIPALVEEVTTPKPGFWKSVGNKFVGAKDKVSSWFSSSS